MELGLSWKFACFLLPFTKTYLVIFLRIVFQIAKESADIVDFKQC